MDWLLVLAPGVLIVALIGGLVVRAGVRRAQLVEAIGAAGWRFVKQARGFDVEGGAEVPWQLRVRRGGGSSSSTMTVWEIPAPPTDGVVLFGPKLPVGIPTGPSRCARKSPWNHTCCAA